MSLGYYKAGQYGIRIENLQAVTELAELGAAEKRMMGFETLTLVPIDRRLIDVTLLTESERSWINNYHLRVRESVRPMVDDVAVRWLTEATRSI